MMVARRITFVTGNKKKLEEVNQIFSGVVEIVGQPVDREACILC